MLVYTVMVTDHHEEYERHCYYVSFLIKIFLLILSRNAALNQWGINNFMGCEEKKDFIEIV